MSLPAKNDLYDTLDPERKEMTINDKETAFDSKLPTLRQLKVYDEEHDATKIIQNSDNSIIVETSKVPVLTIEDQEHKVSVKATAVGDFIQVSRKTRTIVFSVFGITTAVLVAIIAFLASKLGKGSSPVDKILPQIDNSLYSAAISVDFAKTHMLPAKPDTYLNSNVYLPFVYLLPDSFVQNQHVIVQNFTAWYDDYNIKGIQFAFQNDNSSIVTDLFGITADKNGNKTNVTVAVGVPIQSVQTLLVNTQLAADLPSNSGWYAVNFGFNNSTRAGPPDSKYAQNYATRDQLWQVVNPNQRVVGVYGWTRLSDGGLRAIGLLVAD
jgi:hypothetical protein